jgi:hypothetical protein
LVKRLRQSEKVGFIVTVTVRPFGHKPALRPATLPDAHITPPDGLDPTIDAIWLYPVVDASS